MRLVSRLVLCGALALAMLILAGCGSTRGRLEERAAHYYNFMAGRLPAVSLSSFYSPAYRRMFKPDQLRQLNKASGVSKTPNSRYPEIKTDNISIAIYKDPQTRHSFAFSVVDPTLGNVYAQLAPVRWVRDGLSWYIYAGSDAEIGAYGEFPRGFGPPEPPQPAAAAAPNAGSPPAEEKATAGTGNS